MTGSSIASPPPDCVTGLHRRDTAPLLDHTIGLYSNTDIAMDGSSSSAKPSDGQ